MSDFDLTNWKYGRTIDVHIYMAAQYYGELENGWHLLAREHIVKRNYDTAIKSEDTWNEKRASLGFSQFSQADAEALSRNDWLLIVTSFAARLNYVDYFNMWGYRFSDAAIAQVEAYGFDKVPKVFFDYTESHYCEGFNFNPLPVDGNGVWPSNVEIENTLNINSIYKVVPALEDNDDHFCVGHDHGDESFSFNKGMYLNKAPDSSN